MSKAPRNRTWSVQVVFTSAGDPYGREIYAIDAPDASSARRLAIHASTNSIYDDSRIPDLGRRATILRGKRDGEDGTPA